jgi:GNAT superfamily N-acetyltransferase
MPVMKAKTVLLADRPNLIPTLAGWFARVWAPYYGPGGPGDAAGDLQACCHRDRLPICLVAVDADGAALGTASLKDNSVAERPDLGPWLAALVVPPEFAGQGAADFLVAAIEDRARRLGRSALYCDANSDQTLKSEGGWEEAGATLLAGRGWARIGAASSLRGATAIYRRGPTED